MNVIHLGVLGLGQIGSSVALAVKRYQAAGADRQQFNVAGFDIRADVAKAARALGAFDELTSTVGAAVRQKDIVVLAMPYGDVREAYALIAPELKPGAVVLDFSPLTVPSRAWAEALEAREAYQVGVTAALNGRALFDGRDDPAHAAADLFERGALLLSPPAKAHPDAVELASDFAAVLGSTPRFVDAYEADGWASTMETLPALLGVSGFMAARASTGWEDARRTANPAFGRLTHALADAHPDDLHALIMNDRAAALRVIDAEVTVLDELRAVIAAGDSHALAEALEQAFSAYDEWLGRRMIYEWGDQEEKSRASAAEAVMGSFLGGYLTRRLRGKGGGEDE